MMVRFNSYFTVESIVDKRLEIVGLFITSRNEMVYTQILGCGEDQ